jgi:hypothetical protein
LSHAVRRALGSLVVVAVTAVWGVTAGCGGGGEPKPVNAKSLVFTAHDLTGVQGVAPRFPEPCGPVSELEEGGGEAALSQQFKLEGGEAVEAAAVFKGEDPARSVYRALEDPNRLRCIAAAIKRLIGFATVTFEQPQPLDLGDEAAVARYRIVDLSGGGFSNIAFLRVGRCTAAVVISTRDEATANRLTSSTGRIAAGLLTGPCE